MHYQLFSVDDHIIEPRHLWTDRLPAKYREAGPHVVEADGREYWVLEGERQPTMGLNAVAGKPPEEWNQEPVRFEDMRPGCYDPAARAADMALDGIVGSVSFPSLPGFAGRVFLQFSDHDLADLCVRAYNDFIFDEWCAAAPQLFVPTIITQLWDPELAAREVERCAARGARAVALPENPYWLGLPSWWSHHWDPLLRVVTEAGLVLAMHGGSSGRFTQATPDSPFGITIISASGAMGCELIADLMLGRLPQDFPTIKFMLGEMGIGYLPYLLERADFIWEQHGAWAGFGDRRPSDIFREHFFVCAVNETFGIEQRAKIGVENILWESDYPHSETMWPHSQEAAAKTFAGVPDQEAELITHGNAERLFRFPIQA
jgi:predicted TIM-barrel fold metal-dependent hydrolase